MGGDQNRPSKTDRQYPESSTRQTKSRQSEVRSELVCFRETDIVHDSSFFIAEGKTLVVQHGMEQVIDSQ
jgi:hypothetical protein